MRSEKGGEIARRLDKPKASITGRLVTEALWDHRRTELGERDLVLRNGARYSHRADAPFRSSFRMQMLISQTQIVGALEHFRSCSSAISCGQRDRARRRARTNLTPWRFEMVSLLAPISFFRRCAPRFSLESPLPSR
jgi:hypothetical protein